MDDISGLKVIESLSKKPIIILTTAYASYAVKGFDLNVCDYLLKPFDFGRFLQASTKALNQYIAYNEVPAKDTGEGPMLSDTREFIFIKTAYKYKKVRIDDILYLQGMRDYIMIHTTGGKIMTLSSFSEIEKLLPESKFFRIHKSFVVAISKIEAIDRKRAIIAKEYLPISNTYYDAFILFLRKNSIMSNGHKSV
jgi:DNA-binding LytR/AlgR family response regulator